MKKFVLLLPLLLAVVSVTSFARNTPDADPRAEKTFNKYFAGAANVKWSEEGDFLKVSFTWAERQTVAYFNLDGELAGSIRNLFFTQLPLSVMKSVKDSFKNPVMIEVMEISNEEGVHYSLVVEDNHKKYKTRINSFGELIEKTKIRK